MKREVKTQDERNIRVSLEVFKAVTMKNIVFRDIKT
jgi:hypothetical protein